jgi:hypothetical protein
MLDVIVEMHKEYVAAEESNHEWIDSSVTEQRQKHKLLTILQCVRFHSNLYSRLDSIDRQQAQ